MSVYYFMCFLARILLRLLFRVHVKGVENIPRSGPFLIAANHISFLDPVVVGAFVPRDFYYMARDNLFDIPFLGRLIKICHAFPVRRDRPGPETLKRAILILKAGKGLLLFPEGTRSTTGKLRKGGPGVGMLASHTGALVIPTVVAGTEKALPVDARWIRMEKVHVHFGRPVFPSQTCMTKPVSRSTSALSAGISRRQPGGGGEVESKRDRRQVYQKLTDEVMERIRDLQVNL